MMYLCMQILTRKVFGEQVREALLVRHRHQHERRKDNNMSKLPIIRSLAEIGRNHSSSKSKFAIIDF